MGSYTIKSIRDLTIGYDSSTPDHKPTLPVSSSSQMITFTFEDGSVLTIRTSGTEPKIKWYSEMGGSPGKSKDEVQKELDDIINKFWNDVVNVSQYPEIKARKQWSVSLHKKNKKIHIRYFINFHQEESNNAIIIIITPVQNIDFD